MDLSAVYKKITKKKYHTLVLCFTSLLISISCSWESTLRVESIEPKEISECKGRIYTLKGAGFSDSVQIHLDVRAFCGSNPRIEPDYRPLKVAKDGTSLEIFIRPYGHLARNHVNITVIDGEKESTLYKIPVNTCNAEINQLVESLTLEELIGQTLMVGFDALEDDVRISNQGLLDIIREFKIGNAIIFKHNLPRVPDYDDPLAIPKWLATLTNNLQETASESQEAGKKIPLIIAIDQEGGSGNILRGKGFAQIPEHTFIGVTRKSQLARKAGRIVGTQLRYLGVNASLAPIADIVTTDYDRIKGLNHNPTIGIRSFGAHKDFVNKMSTQYMKGLQDKGVLSIAKHFPGHGTSLENPHEVLPNIGIETETELTKTSLSPFAMLIENGVNGLLTSHIIVPPWGKEPVTFSRKIIETQLRDKLGFGGLVVTDDMSTMIGILKSEPSPSQPTGYDTYTRRDAIKLAHEAGHDITILGHIYPDEKLEEEKWAKIRRKKPITRNQIKEIISDLLSLYKEEEEQKRLKECVSRILFQKAILFGHENFNKPANWRIDFVRDDYEKLLKSHCDTADKIFQGSVVLLSEAGNVRDNVKDFQFFDVDRGPLSQGSSLIVAGDKIALASPVHKKPDVLAEAIRSKAKWLDEVETVRMVYGFYSEEAKEQAEYEWPDERIEIMRLLDPLGNFIFCEDDIKRNHFPSIEDDPGVERRIARLRVAARAVDQIINLKVEQIANVARGKKVLVFAIVTRPQIEIMERLRNHLENDLLHTHVIVLLFKEPYLLSRSIYKHPRITVLHLSAFPNLTRAADVLVGRITPKPAQFSALNAPRIQISHGGGASLEPYPVKEIHQPTGDNDKQTKVVIPEIVWILFIGMFGGLIFYVVPRQKLRWTTVGGQYNVMELFWSVGTGLITAVVLAIIFPFIEEFEFFGITLRQGEGHARLVIVFVLSFLVNAAWVRFVVGTGRD